MAAWKKGPLAALVSRVFPPFGGLFLGKPERFVSQPGKLAGFDFAHSPPCDHKVPGSAFGAAGLEKFGPWLKKQVSTRAKLQFL
jgi:hypothetical protein